MGDLNVSKLKSAESELTYFTGIKIDKHSFHNILNRKNKEKYFFQLVQDIKRLGKRTIVDGVNNGNDFNFLLNKNVDGLQGEVWTARKSILP
ncbi:EAL domain-containing protein [Pantoea sp. App145]|uniref:EAL domain-containing protein n=1 Tax=Pantoea sp. App145 TaxID=3071567 RepID=UPI003A80BCF7